MKTIEGNKQITEFMEDGNNYKAIKCKHKILYDCPQVIEPVEDYFLEYDSSWDWLMPVVEKIGTIKPIELHFSVAPSCHIDKVGIKHAWEETQFQNIWLSCVEFIEWYNKQK